MARYFILLSQKYMDLGTIIPKVLSNLPLAMPWGFPNITLIRHLTGFHLISNAKVTPSLNHLDEWTRAVVFQSCVCQLLVDVGRYSLILYSPRNTFNSCPAV